jgi:chromosome segregation ATPase
MELSLLESRINNLEKRLDNMEAKVEQIYSIKEVLSAIEITLNNYKDRDEEQDKQAKEQAKLIQGLVLSLEKLNNKIDNTDKTIQNLEVKVDKFIDSNTISVLDVMKDWLLKILMGAGGGIIAYLTLK